MLSLEEFTGGPLSVAQPLALMLPHSRYGETFLVGQEDQGRIAVFIGEAHKFESFICDTADNWSGLIINGVAIEVDESTVFDPDRDDEPLGSIVRRGTELCIYVRNQHGFGGRPIPLIGGLRALPERHRVGFTRWQIVIGERTEKRVLITIDVTSKDQP